MNEILPNFVKDINLQNPEGQWTSNRINSKETMFTHDTIKLLEAKGGKKTLKATGENWHIIYKGTIIQMTVDFLSEKTGAKRLQNTERKELSNQDNISSENILQEWRWIKTFKIKDEGKLSIYCQQTYSKKNAKESYFFRLQVNDTRGKFGTLEMEEEQYKWQMSG